MLCIDRVKRTHQALARWRVGRLPQVALDTARWDEIEQDYTRFLVLVAALPDGGQRDPRRMKDPRCIRARDRQANGSGCKILGVRLLEAVGVDKHADLGRCKVL